MRDLRIFGKMKGMGAALLLAGPALAAPEQICTAVWAQGGGPEVLVVTSGDHVEMLIGALTAQGQGIRRVWVQPGVFAEAENRIGDPSLWRDGDNALCAALDLRQVIVIHTAQGEVLRAESTCPSAEMVGFWRSLRATLEIPPDVAVELMTDPLWGAAPCERR